MRLILIGRERFRVPVIGIPLCVRKHFLEKIRQPCRQTKSLECRIDQPLFLVLDQLFPAQVLKRFPLTL